MSIDVVWIKSWYEATTATAADARVVQVDVFVPKDTTLILNPENARHISVDWTRNSHWQPVHLRPLRYTYVTTFALQSYQLQDDQLQPELAEIV